MNARDHRQTVEALVLRSRKVNEGDRLLDLLTADGCLLRGKAKWAARSRKRFAGGLEPLTMGSFSLNRRQVQWGWMIDQIQVKESFQALRGDLGSFYLATYLSEVLLQALQPEEDLDGIFEIMHFCLLWLEAGEQDLARVKTFFDLRLLSALGFLAPFHGCSDCGVREGRRWFFHLREGTWHCPRHGEPFGGGLLEMSAGDRRSVEDLAFGDVEKLRRTRWSKAQREKGLALADHGVRLHVGGRMRSLAFLMPFLGAPRDGEELPSRNGKISHGE